jgi:MFS family permease
MLLDISPLRRYRDFRLVFIGQFVSAFGSFITYVALPVQVYALTGSSAAVGLIGSVQLVPLAVTALWGGALADALDRRSLLLRCEALMALGSLALVANSLLPKPSVTLLFAVAAFTSAVNGFHRPALEATTQKLVGVADLAAVSALASLRGTTAAIAAPALAGISIAVLGLPLTYAIEVATFVVSLAALAAMRAMPPAEEAQAAGLATIIEGLRYAAGRPELIGTYIVDIVAMTFAMPMAVFPALAEQLGGPVSVGFLYSAMSVGALLVTLSSAWTRRVRRRGAAIVIAAAVWGLAIVALGFARSLPVAVACLAVAGAADMVSGLFRMTLWNETIPPTLRGRMASIEQLSYMTGPLLGNVRAGFMAERFGLARSIVWGGLICVAGVALCIPALPAFWRYRQTAASAPAGRSEDRESPHAPTPDRAAQHNDLDLG